MRGVRGIYRPVTGRPCVASVLLRHYFSSTDSISKKKLYFISAFSIDLILFADMEALSDKKDSN